MTRLVCHSVPRVSGHAGSGRSPALRVLIGLRRSSVFAAILGALCNSAPSPGDPFPMVKIEFPHVYVQGGVHLYPNDVPFVYTMTPLPAAFWATPLDVDESTPFVVRVTAHGTHLVALHAPEVAPSDTWDSPLMRCSIPHPRGIDGVRVRGGVTHPGSDHEDRYVATLGCFKGTAPRPQLGPGLRVRDRLDRKALPAE